MDNAYPVAHAAFMQLMQSYGEITSMNFVRQCIEEALQARRPHAVPALSAAQSLPVKKQDKRRQPRIPPGQQQHSQNSQNPNWDRRRRGHRGRYRHNDISGPSMSTNPFQAPFYEQRQRRPLFVQQAPRQEDVRMTST